MKAAHPIHTELFDGLYNDWATLEKFQWPSDLDHLFGHRQGNQRKRERRVGARTTSSGVLLSRPVAERLKGALGHRTEVVFQHLVVLRRRWCL